MLPFVFKFFCLNFQKIDMKGMPPLPSSTPRCQGTLFENGEQFFPFNMMKALKVDGSARLPVDKFRGDLRICPEYGRFLKLFVGIRSRSFKSRPYSGQMRRPPLGCSMEGLAAPTIL
jgi:hypothetical protein